MDEDLFRPPVPVVPHPDPRTPIGYAISLSAVIHAFILALIVSLTWRGCIIVLVPPMADKSGEDGEKGRSGSGGSAVEVALEAPPAERMGGARAAAPASAPSTETQPTPNAAPTPNQSETPSTTQSPQHDTGRSAHAPRPTQPAHDNEPAEAPPPAPAEPRAGTNAHASPASTPSEAQPGAPGGGTGEFLRNSGLRPGSVGQQRAILPRAVHCDDEVVGTWRAQKYDPIYGDWMLATLFIHRGASNEIHGSMVVHQWDGGPFSIRPSACGPDGFDFLVDEPAEGFATGRHVDFGAHSWRLREVRCNGALRAIDYHPDHFTGTIDPEREEFQSVNNDGGRAVNDPMVFRRIGCLDQVPRASEAPSDGGGP